MYRFAVTMAWGLISAVLVGSLERQPGAGF